MPDAKPDKATLRSPDTVAHTILQLGARGAVEIDRHQLRLTSLDKVLWPASDDGSALTKRDLLLYLAQVSPYLLAYLQDRPLTIIRFPGGIEGKRFVQRHAQQVPSFVKTVRIYTEDVRADRDYLLCNNLATLVWLGQMNALELHAWYSRAVSSPETRRVPTRATGSEDTVEASIVNYPDFLVFDLDPYLYSGREKGGAEPELHRAGFQRTAEVALHLKELLDERGLIAYVKTSGRTGLHVFIPTRRTARYEATRELAIAIAAELVARHPSDATAEWSVSARKGKVFVDVNQNVRGKTLPPPYSPRRSVEASVSMPLRWDELGQVYPTQFTIRTAQERLADVGDLWADILSTQQDLSALTKAPTRLRSRRSA
jgi:bifunctional non-homologous end joining protein LigD